MDRYSKEFKTLQRKWNKKLKQSGFEDIEYQDPDTKEYALKWSPTKNFTKAFYREKENAGIYEAKETYFRLAGFMLHDYEFEDKIDKLIWEWHAEGKTMREISAQLKKKYKRKGLSVTHVKECIHKIRKIMLKKYESAPND